MVYTINHWFITYYVIIILRNIFASIVVYYKLYPVKYVVSGDQTNLLVPRPPLTKVGHGTIILNLYDHCNILQQHVSGMLYVLCSEYYTL